MYNISPISLKTLTDDNSIKFPRFQRKQSWDEIKNFKLCLSVFKQFPIGTIILQIDKDENRLLLDGRQRTHAIKLMIQNPEIIYDWAKKFLGFKNSIKKDEIRNLFDSKVNLFLGDDHDDDDNDETSLID